MLLHKGIPKEIETVLKQESPVVQAYLQMVVNDNQSKQATISQLKDENENLNQTAEVLDRTVKRFQKLYQATEEPLGLKTYKQLGDELEEKQETVEKLKQMLAKALEGLQAKSFQHEKLKTDMEEQSKVITQLKDQVTSQAAIIQRQEKKLFEARSLSALIRKSLDGQVIPELKVNTVLDGE